MNIFGEGLFELVLLASHNGAGEYPWQGGKGHLADKINGPGAGLHPWVEQPGNGKEAKTLGGGNGEHPWIGKPGNGKHE